MPSETLIGREAELAWLRGLTASAQAGLSAVSVLEGEAGMGKTALVQSLANALRGFDVLSIAGVEAESDLPFVAVQRLVLARRDAVEALPAQHRAALLVATGLEHGTVADRLTVGLALLSLLATLSERTPVFCWIDDAHWVDDESLGALAFVGRRLLADRVVLLFSRRPVAEPSMLAGIDIHRLSGLAAHSAVDLLTSRLGVSVEPAVAREIVDATRGNPLALVDLGGELSVRQLEGAALLPEPMPIGEHLEAHYLRLVRALPAASQQWLLIAAAESGGDLRMITHTAEMRGLSSDAATAAEHAGLITVSDRVRFRHPLVRSAIYGGAPSSELRRVHADLSSAAEVHGNEDQRIWHLACTVNGIDEDLAEQLEIAGATAARRGGTTAQTKLLIRAAQASGPGTRPGRLLTAAEYSVRSGSSTQAAALLSDIDPARLGPVDRARLSVVQADIDASRNGHYSGRTALLLNAAKQVADHDHHRAVEYTLMSFNAAILAGSDLRKVDFAEFAEFALSLGANQSSADVSLIALRAFATLMLDGPKAAAPQYRRAVAAALEAELDSDVPFYLFAVLERLTSYYLDDPGRSRTLAAFESLARQTGAIWLLTLVRSYQLAADNDAGRVRQATERRDEIIAALGALGSPLDSPGMAGFQVGLLAWSGEAEQLADQVDSMMERCHTIGAGLAAQLCRLALLNVAAAQGRHSEVEPFAALEFPDVRDPLVTAVTLDVIEVAARTGHAEKVADLAAELEERVDLVGTDYGRGFASLTRALVSDDPEPHFARAVDYLGRSDAALIAARARLLYGEWLRRQRRRADATAELEAAATAFAAEGAPLWVERAARELSPLGTTGRETVAAGAESDLLTPQERSVARLAADGATNVEIADRLYLSPSTIDYHLRKVFRKLEVTSRRQLRSVLR